MSDRRSYFVPLSEIEANHKSAVSAALLALFLGVFGAHRFYLGRKKSGTAIVLINLLSFGLALFITLPLVLIEGFRYAHLARKRHDEKKDEQSLPELREQFHDVNQKLKADMQANNTQFRKDISDIFARPKTQSKPEATDLDIIDVHESTPEPIPIPAMPLNSTDWLHLLELPYERQAMRIPQIKEETLKLYAALCNLIDKELRNERDNAYTLLKLKQELDRSGEYYSNILYTIYCIAEGEIVRHYSRRSGYNNSFSYDLLRKHTNERFAELTNEFCARYATLLPPADETTQNAYHLTSTGLQFAWWDQDGSIRKELALTKEQTSLFEHTFHRSTAIMRIPEVRLLVARQYLATMKALRHHFQNPTGWKPTTIAYLEYAFGKRAYYGFNDYSAWRVGSGILKLCEQTIRQNLPYSRLLRTEEEVAAIKAALPDVVSKDVLERAARLAEPITLGKETIEALRKQNPSAWRRNINTLDGATPEECVSTLKQYESDPDFVLITKQAVKHTQNQPVSCLLACYAHYAAKVDNQHEAERSVEEAMQKIITHPYQQKAFMELVQQKLPLNAELIKVLKTLTKPPVRSVRLDTRKVEAAHAAHEEAVKRVTGYLGEDGEPDKSEAVPAQQKAEITIDDLFGGGGNLDAPGLPSLSSDQIEFLRLLAGAGYNLELAKAETFARAKHKLLGSFIQGINQKYYELFEDQLLSTVDDKITVEEAYREQVKEILTT